VQILSKGSAKSKISIPKYRESTFGVRKAEPEDHEEEQPRRKFQGIRGQQRRRSSSADAERQGNAALQTDTGVRPPHRFDPDSNSDVTN
jgi:hypothetical protein